MKKLTVDDFLKWHNNACGFSRCPVIVQLDNDPPHERELSLYFFPAWRVAQKAGCMTIGFVTPAVSRILTLTK